MKAPSRDEAINAVMDVAQGDSGPFPSSDFDIAHWMDKYDCGIVHVLVDLAEDPPEDLDELLEKYHMTRGIWGVSLAELLGCAATRCPRVFESRAFRVTRADARAIIISAVGQSDAAEAVEWLGRFMVKLRDLSEPEWSNLAGALGEYEGAQIQEWLERMQREVPEGMLVARGYILGALRWRALCRLAGGTTPTRGLILHILRQLVWVEDGTWGQLAGYGDVSAWFWYGDLPKAMSLAWLPILADLLRRAGDDDRDLVERPEWPIVLGRILVTMGTLYPDETEACMREVEGDAPGIEIARRVLGELPNVISARTG